VWWGWGVVGVGGNPELQKMFNLPQGKFQVFKPSSKQFEYTIAHDVTAPVTMYLEDKLAIYS
jgi:hypothetical protein